ncbi:hypothetical protein FFLO_06033 [Filobasidium floriforme]|uniref:Uncharacterized protein n=1 Tax=Filobasidium floriforme TaxID=5210 RepID=A0A8K0JHI9_9TREE|nr:uncharacterized protein HD553DRAFT_369312 [Filobasidium floriforme]KAG7528640.1 hypothetical protein FFLO_06033 [Filobasidium floriforme]KAH8087091.1 hypothetical protein HD553DRAFT_369312 [Filobasidium floriforme]
MEQSSTTPRDGSINQSFFDMSVNTFLESLSRLLYGTSDEGSGDGASISQGEPHGSGFDASSKSAANESKGNQNIAREQEHPAELNATFATSPVILRLVEAYRKEQKPCYISDTLRLRVFGNLCRYKNACQLKGRPQLPYLDLQILTEAWVAVTLPLSQEAFELFCEELLKCQADLDPKDRDLIRKGLQQFCETSRQTGQTAEVNADVP